jgi:hypothetical protein
MPYIREFSGKTVGDQVRRPRDGRTPRSADLFAQDVVLDAARRA